MSVSRTMPRRLFNPNMEYVIADDSKLPMYDGSNLRNVKPVSTKLMLTEEDGAFTTWSNDHKILTVTHTLNCIPVVTVLDGNGTQIFPTVTVTSGTAFILDFSMMVEIDSESPWTIVINYGGEYGDDSVISDSISTVLLQMQHLVDEAEAARNAARAAKTQAEGAYQATANIKSEMMPLANAIADAQAWAEGTDSAVSSRGGEHSAKGWAEYASACLAGITDYIAFATTLNEALESYNGDTTQY